MKNCSGIWMKAIRWTSAFKADYKLVKRSSRNRISVEALTVAVTALADDEAMPYSFRDHALAGTWNGCRECHLAPDLLLIYRYEGEPVVALVRMGTHSELFR